MIIVSFLIECFNLPTEFRRCHCRNASKLCVLYHREFQCWLRRRAGVLASAWEKSSKGLINRDRLKWNWDERIFVWTYTYGRYSGIRSNNPTRAWGSAGVGWKTPWENPGFLGEAPALSALVFAMSRGTRDQQINELALSNSNQRGFKLNPFLVHILYIRCHPPWRTSKGISQSSRLLQASSRRTRRRVLQDTTPTKPPLCHAMGRGSSSPRSQASI